MCTYRAEGACRTLDRARRARRRRHKSPNDYNESVHTSHLTPPLFARACRTFAERPETQARDLALGVCVDPKHLSFRETAKNAPPPGLQSLGSIA